MPRDKDFKRLVRTRMEKTGEAYTAARARLLDKSPRETVPTPADPEIVAETERPDYAAIAGVSDATIEAKTGCTWERWVYALDRHRAAEMSHGDIAKLVHEKYYVAGWWAQTVTVGYERIKGLREKGQRRDGLYEASCSRTFGVPVDVLFDAWADAASRGSWLSADPVVRTVSRPRSIRLGWPDGTIVALWFTARSATRSVVAVQHTRLPDRDVADGLRQYWREQLDALKDFLGQ